MKSDTYEPNPIDTADLQLSPELTALTEAIAKNVHEVWSQNRMAEGWQYGAQRDDALKQHPCLVPYEELSDTEKEYDRATALGTLKLIQRLGFDIVKRQ